MNTLEGTIYFLAGIAVLRIAETADPVFGFAFFGVVSIASNGVRFVRVAYRRIKRLDLVPPPAAPVAAARP
ncbi:hypothetical protein PJ267_17320 [Arthrobacter sp. OVS8]|nr:hypothetical protein PJ267_17320 [Arthrobacter sp. OVS8]